MGCFREVRTRHIGCICRTKLRQGIPMKLASHVVLVLALFLAPAASYAISVPLPSNEATLNLNLQLQPQFIVNQPGTPDGMNPSYDLFLLRSRIPLNGTAGQHVSYYIQ